MKKILIILFSFRSTLNYIQVSDDKKCEDDHRFAAINDKWCEEYHKLQQTTARDVKTVTDYSKQWQELWRLSQIGVSNDKRCEDYHRLQ